MLKNKDNLYIIKLVFQNFILTFDTICSQTLIFNIIIFSWEYFFFLERK